MIYDLEDHSDQVSNVSVNSQKVEHLKPKEDDTEAVDWPLYADESLHVLVTTLIEAADSYYF